MSDLPALKAAVEKAEAEIEQANEDLRSVRIKSADGSKFHSLIAEDDARNALSAAYGNHTRVHSIYLRRVAELREARKAAYREFIRITHELHEVGEEAL